MTAYEHSRPCATPSTRWRRPGSLWACPSCRGVWIVVRVGGYDSEWKTWERL